MDIEVASKFLKDVSIMLEKAGVEHWVDGGTALGIFRDGHLIEHDHDIDIVMRHSDLAKIDPAIFKKYEAYYSKIKGNPVSFDMFYKGIGLNIFFAYDIGYEFECFGISDGRLKIVYRTPKHYYEKSFPVTLDGREYRIPGWTDEYLTIKYGKWQESNSKWSTVHDGFLYMIKRLNKNEKVVVTKI